MLISVNQNGFNEEGKTVLSTPEVEEILGITKNTVYKWIDKGKLKPRKIKAGKKTVYLFKEEEIETIKSKMKKKREKGKSLL